MSELSGDDLIIIAGQKGMSELIDLAEDGDEHAQWVLSAISSWFEKYQCNTPNCIECDQPMLKERGDIGIFTIADMGAGAGCFAAFCKTCSKHHRSPVSLAAFIKRKSELPKFSKAIAQARAMNLPIGDCGHA